VKDSRLHINSELAILLSEISFTYARSSGPGGQNVNKVNSKAILRWNLLVSTSVTEEVRETLLTKLSNKINNEGELIISSDVFRDQLRNREDCLQRLKTLLLQALFVPKKRKKTKKSWSRTKKNEASKKLHSEKKRMRKPIL
jgi:ribosome-associated protein